MASLKTLIFFVLAVAMVMAAEPERVKKDVLLGGAYPYGAYSGYGSAAYVPTAYSAYSALPYAYSGYAHAGYAHPYSAYPAYRSIVY